MEIATFLPKKYIKSIDTGSVTWKSPSNIALIKYWGKKEDQIPQNPSISFTLDTCTTVTKLTYKKRAEKDSNFSFDLYF